MEELVKEAQKGNKEALTILIKDIKNDLYKIARMRLTCGDDIEDAVQETMIEAFNSIKKLKEPALFKKWIIKILINKCNKIYRKRKKNNISFEDLELENYLASNQIEDYNKELQFYQMLKNLNYDERITLILYYKEDFKISDIAKTLNTNENTVKTRIKRAKDKIRKDLEGRE